MTIGRDPHRVYRNVPDQAASLTTLNARGRTTSQLNEINELFVQLAASAEFPVLDLGCAFGVAALAALKAGADVVAVDMEPAHIARLDAACPASARMRLTLQVKVFPSETEFPEGSLAVIHASNLFNFLTGDEITSGLGKCARWLIPGGYLLTISGTPYARNIQEFIKVYERNRQEGIAWPGECPNLHTLCADETIAELPQFLHLLDPDVLTAAAERAGLKVEEAKFINRRGTPSYIAWDGRENVVLVARKPG